MDDCQDQFDGIEKPSEFHTTCVYLSGLTHGVVGGWNFTLDHERCVVKCYDIWDFNPTTLDLQIKVPDQFRKLIQTMLDKLNVPYHAHEMFDSFTQFEFNENKLYALNDRHAFLTEWEFSIEGLSCPLHYDQAKYDWSTPAQQSRYERPTDEQCQEWSADMDNWF